MTIDNNIDATTDIKAEIIKKKPRKKKVNIAINYEQAFTQLENLVNGLDDTDLPLEDALKNFEMGIKLTHQCQQALAEAEQKVQLLMQQNSTN